MISTLKRTTPSSSHSFTLNMKFCLLEEVGDRGTLCRRWAWGLIKPTMLCSHLDYFLGRNKWAGRWKVRNTEVTTQPSLTLHALRTLPSTNARGRKSLTLGSSARGGSTKSIKSCQVFWGCIQLCCSSDLIKESMLNVRKESLLHSSKPWENLTFGNS